LRLIGTAPGQGTAKKWPASEHGSAFTMPRIAFYDVRIRDVRVVHLA
jgi:hypothetical protein